MRRMAITLAVLCIGIGSARAQAPEDGPPVLGPVREPGPLASFLRTPSGPVLPSDGRFWIAGDYLVAFLRGTNLPALVTTSEPGTTKLNAGVIGLGSTSTLFGPGWVNDDIRSGVRLQTGYWFNSSQTLGIEAGFMVIEGQSASFVGNSDAFPILARPFFNTETGVQGSHVIAFPGFSNGSIDIRVVSANFWETHVDLSEKAIDTGWFRLYSLFGYRYFRYDEYLRATEIINPTNRNFIAGTQIVSTDNFNTRNEFHGIDLGFRSQFIWDRLTIDVLTKLAVGRINRTIDINGQQTISTPGFGTITRDGGVLALGSNSGLSSSGDWKVLPEAGVNLNWQVGSNLNMRFGYTFMLLNGIARVVDKVDTTINPNFFPGGSSAGVVRPANNNVRSDMWIQSLNVGLIWTY